MRHYSDHAHIDAKCETTTVVVSLTGVRLRSDQVTACYCQGARLVGSRAAWLTRLWVSPTRLDLV